MTQGMNLNIDLDRLKPELDNYLEVNCQEQTATSPNAADGNKEAAPLPFSEKTDLTARPLEKADLTPRFLEKADLIPQLLEKADLTPRQEKDLSELLNELGDSFHEKLFSLIAQSGLPDTEVYRRADLDRKLFSKIRSNPAYHPGKGTVLALCIALELSIKDAEDLLSRAGYAFSPGNKGDLIVKFFIEHGVYDIDAVKYTLEEYGQTLT